MAKRGRPKKSIKDELVITTAKEAGKRAAKKNTKKAVKNISKKKKQSSKDEDEQTSLNQQINWEDQLIEDEIIRDEDGNTYVPLKALERLARLKGWTTQWVNVVKFPTTSDMLAVVQYSITWADGTTSCGCGDAHLANCDNNFALYLTSMAETRAYARTLRRGLGISICSREEVSIEKTADDLGDLVPCTDDQMMLIKRLIEERGKTFLELMIETGHEEIEDISELTKGQATKLLKWLQSNKNNKAAKKNK